MADPATILRNARIYTMDPRRPTAVALAWRGDRLLAVGPADEVAAAAGPGARVIDAAGQTVIPGLIDAHIHFMWYAAGLLRVDLEGVPDPRRRAGARGRPRRRHAGRAAGCAAAAGTTTSGRPTDFPTPPRPRPRHGAATRPS